MNIDELGEYSVVRLTKDMRIQSFFHQVIEKGEAFIKLDPESDTSFWYPMQECPCELSFTDEQLLQGDPEVVSMTLQEPIGLGSTIIISEPRKAIEFDASFDPRDRQC